MNLLLKNFMKMIQETMEGCNMYKNVHYLFKAWYKPGKCWKLVYAVRDDKNGFPSFLVYINHQWKYVSAKHFIPEQIEDINV